MQIGPPIGIAYRHLVNIEPAALLSTLPAINVLSQGFYDCRVWFEANHSPTRTNPDAQNAGRVPEIRPDIDRPIATIRQPPKRLRNGKFVDSLPGYVGADRFVWIDSDGQAPGKANHRFSALVPKQLHSEPLEYLQGLKEIWRTSQPEDGLKIEHSLYAEAR